MASSSLGIYYTREVFFLQFMRFYIVNKVQQLYNIVVRHSNTATPPGGASARAWDVRAGVSRWSRGEAEAKRIWCRRECGPDVISVIAKHRKEERMHYGR